TVCVVGKMRDLILQLSKSSIYSTKPPATTILSNNPVNSVFSNDNSHFTYRHIDFSIELLLSSGTDSQLEYLFLKPAAEVKIDLQRRLASGERYVTTESCDNFSEVDGCMGHDC
ncbi:hypothetical protein, partial [Escherichia coli]|uniref:hypothetical protein n=2 Tax=Escherichia coli TaxID=562 RepID=UPI002074685F